MNSLAQRFSTTTPLAQFRKLKNLAEQEDDFSESSWGSQAGFGSIAKGLPKFTVPNIPDVSYTAMRRKSEERR